MPDRKPAIDLNANSRSSVSYHLTALSYSLTARDARPGARFPLFKPLVPPNLLSVASRSPLFFWAVITRRPNTHCLHIRPRIFVQCAGHTHERPPLSAVADSGGAAPFLLTTQIFHR